MDAERAFEIVCSAVASHSRRRMVESFFGERHFGNFWVSFEDDGRARCVVNDRGYLTLTQNLDGTGEPLAAINSLHEFREEDFLQGLGL